MGEESSKPNVLWYDIAKTKPNNCYTKNTIISKELSKESADFVDLAFRHFGLDGPNFPTHLDTKDSFSRLTRECLKLHNLQPGKVSCVLSVKPAILNLFYSLHGGAIGAVAETVSIACARTIVGNDTELFLGELSTSYISAAPSNAEVAVDGCVIRSGRSLTVVAVDFRLKDSGKLVCTSNATLYHMPVANL